MGGGGFAFGSSSMEAYSTGACHYYGYVNVCMIFVRREVPYDSVSMFSILRVVLTLYNMLVT